MGRGVSTDARCENIGGRPYRWEADGIAAGYPDAHRVHTCPRFANNPRRKYNTEHVAYCRAASKLYASVLGLSMAQAPAFDSWADLWRAFAALVAGRQQILVLDEVPYAAESDPAFLSALQHAWEQHLKDSRLILILSGSHVHIMGTLLARGSPWHLNT